MKKSKILGNAIHLVVLVIFNALYFGIWGLNHPASAWIAYAFITFSYIMIIATPHITQKGKDRATYAAAMYGITSTYFNIELVVGAIFIIAAPAGYKLSFFSQLIIAGIYLIILFSNMIADEHTAAAVEKHEAELIYVKQSCAMLKPLLDEISDKRVCREVEKAYDLIQSSPVKSHQSVHGLERQIMDEIDNLVETASQNSGEATIALANRIVKLANERNRLLRLAN